MDTFSASLYGVVQGLTEFLPISSSGHLALIPQFLDISDPGVAFDLTMHVGTAMAVIVYFRKELQKLIKDTFWFFLRRPEKLSPRYYLPLYMLGSTLTTLILVLGLKDFVEKWGARTPQIIAFNLAFFGLLMVWADLKKKKSPQKDEWMIQQKQWKKALMIGLFQGLAIFPGVSRSGATLTISRFLGLERNEAARYSFLLSLPIILGGFILKLPDLFQEGSTVSLGACLWGMSISFIVGLLSIHLFLKLVQNLGLGLYAIYRIILAGIILTVL
jgi:undecaprenyl-diphosphatase